jgi:N-acetylmuramic acid 6-phosphate etherase
MTILTEQSNPATKDIDLYSGVETARILNAEDQKVALAVSKEVENIGRVIELVAESFKKGGRLAYFGAGTSGRLGVLDASECPPTFGVDEGLVRGYIAGGERALRHSVENAEDREDLALEDIADFAPTANDVIVGISASGNPRYVLCALKEARKAGTVTVALSCNPAAQAKDLCDVFICPVVGPEAVTGSSRLKAGTAQKMVLNMISTGAMIRIGKTYQNYMIDLKMLNEKLVQRGQRFVAEITGADLKTAAEMLDKSGGRVKTACVMIACRLGRVEAEKRLAEVGGILRKVIE